MPPSSQRGTQALPVRYASQNFVIGLARRNGAYACLELEVGTQQAQRLVEGDSECRESAVEPFEPLKRGEQPSEVQLSSGILQW